MFRTGFCTGAGAALGEYKICYASKIGSVCQQQQFVPAKSLLRSRQIVTLLVKNGPITRFISNQTFLLFALLMGNAYGIRSEQEQRTFWLEVPYPREILIEHAAPNEGR